MRNRPPASGTKREPAAAGAAPAPAAGRFTRLAPLLASAACLLLFYALSLGQSVTTSPTFDEGFTVLRGYAAWRTGYLVPIGHPPLAHWISGLGVLLEPGLPDPRGLDGWSGDEYDDASRDLLWRGGVNAGRVVFLGRFPILLLGLMLGAVTARWAADLLGWRGALAALALHALSPNLLAHAAVATTDLPVAAFYVAGLFAWHRFARRPNLTGALAAGATLGLALAAKFSALLLLPTVGGLALARLRGLRRRPAELRSAALSTSAALISGFVTLWASYGFAAIPYPLAQYVRELLDLGQLATEGHAAYLFGRLSLMGWWYYHPVVFLVKTPLPLLILLATAAAMPVLRRLRHMAVDRPEGDGPQPAIGVYVALPAAIHLLAATFSSLNVGYRYLLPALPLLHIVAASTVRRWPPMARSFRGGSWIGALLLGYHFISTAAVAPHFLAYFNEFVGPANGYKVLADSNLDWGQDLPALARYLKGRPVYLSYFGQADPHYYGIRYTPLPGWPPPPVEPDFSPADPASGLYAISASNLVGVQLDDPNTFAYFRDLEPLAVVNYSIFIYESPERQPAASFAQCAPPLLSTSRQLLNREVRQIEFDCANSFLQPAAPGLALYPEGRFPLIDLGAPVFEWRRADGTTYYRLYRSDPMPLPEAPIAYGQYLYLLSYDLSPEAITLEWLVAEPAPPPVSIFVHFNWPDGALAEAYDALGVPAEYWQPGDVIIQRHPVSPDLPPGEYGVAVGLYSLADGTRYSDIPLTTFRK